MSKSLCGIPHFLKMLEYKRVGKVWTRRDLQRVFKKIKELATVKEHYEPIEFNDAEMLSYFLDEPLDCRLYWAIKHLWADDLIAIYKHPDKPDYYCLEPLPF